MYIRSISVIYIHIYVYMYCDFASTSLDMQLAANAPKNGHGTLIIWVYQSHGPR